MLFTKNLFGVFLKKTLMLIAVLMLNLTATAQQQGLNLLQGTYSIDELFRELSASTGYHFTVDIRFDRTRTVHFAESPQTLAKALELVLTDSGYTYEVRDRYIMIKNDPDSNQYANQQSAKNPDIDPMGPKIYYFVIDKTLLLRDYDTNRPMLDALDILLRDPQIYNSIDSIVVTAAASPIASPQHNARLAIGRAEALATYVRWQHPQVDRNKIYTYPLGIDWEGFWSLIENTPGVPSRGSIMGLKDRFSEEVTLDMLRTVGGYGTYNYLLKTIYPKLQYAAVRVVLNDGKSIPATGSPLRKMVEGDIKYDTVYFERIIRDTVWINTPVPVDVTEKVEPIREPRKPFYFALKNNLIYDIALLPNLGVEIPFGRNYRWSVELEGQWSWWNTNSTSWWYHRIQMAGAEMRYWLGNRTEKDPMHGWYLGAYGYAGTYDLRLFTKENPDLGQLSDFSYSAGISVGYAVPLSRRLSMDFGLGIGYFGGEYKKYYRSSCDDVFPWVSTHQRSWFGPTKAKISLVWQIGSGVNSKYKNKKSRL